MANFIIREYFPAEDNEQLEQLLSSYLEIWNHPENLPYLSLTQVPFDEQTVREWFLAHRDVGVHYFAALDNDDSILGIAVVRVNPVIGIELGGIGVRVGHKGQGIGGALIKTVLEKASSDGFRAVDVRVFTVNVWMLRLLLGMGFIPVRMEHPRGSGGEDLLHLKYYLENPS